MRKGLTSACGFSEINLRKHENENKIKCLSGRRCCVAAAFVTGCLHLPGQPPQAGANPKNIILKYPCSSWPRRDEPGPVAGFPALLPSSGTLPLWAGGSCRTHSSRLYFIPRRARGCFYPAGCLSSAWRQPPVRLFQPLAVPDHPPCGSSPGHHMGSRGAWDAPSPSRAPQPVGGCFFPSCKSPVCGSHDSGLSWNSLV